MDYIGLIWSVTIVCLNCLTAGWIIKIEVSDKSEYDKLMTPDQYKEFLKDSL